MTESSTRKLMLLDACVLIDYWKAEKSILQSFSTHLGGLHVASPVLDSKVQTSVAKFPLTRFGNLSGLGQSLALDAWYDKKFTITSFRTKSEENKQIPESEIRDQLYKLSTGYGWVNVSDDEVAITDLGEKR